jgi:hypothetical protein
MPVPPVSVTPRRPGTQPQEVHKEEPRILPAETASEPAPVVKAPAVTPPPKQDVLTPVNEITAIVDLPSKGKFYGDKCPDGVVFIRPMTGRDEALVAGMDQGEMSDVFDILIDRCLLTPGIRAADMLATDKFYIMLCLRANSYGGTYEFKGKCPYCGFFQFKSCQVPNDFEVIWFEGDDTEPFKVILPRCKAEIGFRLLRGEDDKDIIAYRKRLALKGRESVGDTSYIYRMAKHIVSINGEDVTQNTKKAMDFFENLIAGDASALSKAIDSKVSGVNTELEISCSQCKNSFRMDMPFTAGFFRS